MSNLEPDPSGGVAVAPPFWPGSPDRSGSAAREDRILDAREVPLGGPRAMTVRRTLPHRARRTVGAWCFADSYGPAAGPMHVPPHPHSGLQTVSWLLDGEILHLDSLGSRQLVRPGQLNLMTAGHGISHAEDSLPAAPGEPASGPLHGVQLWVALPDADRDTAPHFEHHADLPALTGGGVRAVVVMGELAGERSPARTYTPLLAAEVSITPGGRLELPLSADFEHAVLALDGTAAVDGAAVPPSSLVYLGRGRARIDLASDAGGRLLLLGGAPFEEELLMWWNFVGRDHDEIAAARQDWEEGDRFGEFEYDGGRLPAPALPTARLKARPSVPV